MSTAIGLRSRVPVLKFKLFLRRGLLCGFNATSQVKLRIALIKEQKHSQNRIFLGYSVAEAPPVFQAGRLAVSISFSFFVRFVFLSGIPVLVLNL
jgi:hypothetical protein